MARIKGLDHIGVAVDQVDEVARVLCDVLGATRLGIEDLPAEGLRVVSIDAGGTHVELFEPQVPNSVRRFIEKRGNAMHHICLEVENLDAELDRLRSAGIQLIDETPREGAYGKRVAFIHPKATAGLLIELSECPS